MTHPRVRIVARRVSCGEAGSVTKVAGRMRARLSVMPPPSSDAAPDVRGARYALAILTFINLFNYLDRWVVAAVVESIKKSELALSDTQLGLVGTGFIIVYTMTSPMFGAMGDRKRRPPLIALGVALWSIATSLAGFAQGFLSLFLARSSVGVGEAAYGTIAPALLADSFPLERRGRVLSKDIRWFIATCICRETGISWLSGPLRR